MPSFDKLAEARKEVARKWNVLVKAANVSREAIVTDPLLTRPEFQEAVEAAMREYSIDPASATDGERENWRNNLTAALPALRRMLAEELRDEAAKGKATYSPRCPFPSAWRDAADFLVRKEVMT